MLNVQEEFIGSKLTINGKMSTHAKGSNEANRVCASSSSLGSFHTCCHEAGQGPNGS